MKATHHPPTLDHQPGTTPAVLLRGAAAYLTRHGWTQHQFFDLLADTCGPFPPACASGAIMTAAAGRCLAEGIGTLDPDDPEARTALTAMRVFADWLDGGYVPAEGFPASAIDVIGDWNDHDGRTLDEVVECLIMAADDWDRIHTTGGAR
ncbi:hypothetical protein [Krasilnikovia sp. M28-CT-15]|uniref:DUF6197 family protein n=1 Tax=Krasilnikovia sp. M28-CT-15 TaxID=3373540 RepID=UPI003876405F